MQTSYAEWSAEIIIVASQIRHWLESQSADEPIIQVIRKVEVADAMILGVSETLWDYIAYGLSGDFMHLDKGYEFEPELECSDIWECAVAQALADFRAG